MELGKFEGQLTPEGAERFVQAAERLADGIDAEKELIVIWKSPRNRAEQSSDILERVFTERGIHIIRTGTKDSLRDVGLKLEYARKIVEDGSVRDWMQYWSHDDELPEGVETPAEMKKRIERVLTYLERVATKVSPPEGIKLHFVCIGHEEIIRDVLEESFEQGTKAGEGPSYGEIMRVDIARSTPENDATLDVKYREMEAELGFKPQTREFYKRPKP
jgi:broad specificity phosphatase PhoE